MMEIIQNAFYMTLLFVLGTMGMGYVLGKVNTLYKTNINKTFGYKKIRFTEIIGVPVHELGHYIMCKIFGMRVDEVNLLNGDSSYNLGHVKYSYNSLSPKHNIGNYFVAQGPLWTGSILVVLIMLITMPEVLSEYKIAQGIILNNLEYSVPEKVAELVIFNIGNIVKVLDIRNLKSWVFMVFSIGISVNSDMSSTDIKEALKGAKYIFIAVFILNILFGNSKIVIAIAKYNMYVLSVLTLLLTISVIALIISVILGIIFKRK